MKKLMTVAAVLAFGCVAHAASFTWGFSSDSIIKPGGGSGDYLSGGTAFLFLGTVTATEAGFDFSSATLLATAGQSLDYTFGAFDSNNLVSNDAFTSTAAGQTYTLILVDKGVTSLADYVGSYILSNGLSGMDTDPISGATWGVFIDNTAYAGSAWSTMSNVPEPTSGLLLLLGVAGLALKRKRA